MKILVDADACPKDAKEILYSATERLSIELLIVANQFIRTPPKPNIRNVVVGQGFNVADDKIEELTEPGDIVITSDIPLADRVVKKGGWALSPRGEIFDEENISGRLAVRDLMEDLRNNGMITGGPSAYSPRDKSSFANALNRLVDKVRRAKRQE